MSSLTAITPAVLDPVVLARLVDDPGHGAVSTFVGVVRNHHAGRRVTRLIYEAYEPLALKALDRILAECAEAWPTTRVAIHHRTGPLAIGEASVVIAAGSPHRADAFAATRYSIERIKQIVPIWKHEFFEGGEDWVEGATADPDDAAAKAEAMRLACA